MVFTRQDKSPGTRSQPTCGLGKSGEGIQTLDLGEQTQVLCQQPNTLVSTITRQLTAGH